MRRDAQVQTATTALKVHEDAVDNLDNIRASVCAGYRESELSKLDIAWKYGLAVYAEELAKAKGDAVAAAAAVRQQKIVNRAFVAQDTNSNLFLGQHHSLTLVIRSMYPEGRALCAKLDERRNEYFDTLADVMVELER
jgi:hypothetical protein